MFKHGMSRTRFYRIYRHIWNRCNRKENENYKTYGGKGIKNKRKTFESFMDDMFEGYNKLSKDIGEKNVSIDRINNSGNYCKDNCRRIHISKQQSNRDINNYLKWKGKKQTIREWAKEIGIREGTLRNRILYYKMDVETALTKKVGNYFGNPTPVLVIYNGKKYTVKELEKIVKYSRKTIYRKIKTGELNILDNQ